MSIYDYEAAFSAADVTTTKMKNAMQLWRQLYYRDQADSALDAGQRIAYTVVNKICKTVFAEYRAYAKDEKMGKVLSALDAIRLPALQESLVTGGCFLKPVLGEKLQFSVIPRDNALIFARDGAGNPTDMGFCQQASLGNAYYTLLERRYLENGKLTIENRLFRSGTRESLGQEVSLSQHPDFADLPQRYTYESVVPGLGLIYLKTPMLNCVDGSSDGVSVYAPAAGLIENIDRNEALLNGEFERGQSRVFASRDILDGGLNDNLFVGLDEGPETVGLTVYAPALREASFFARKQEYLRNIESVIGLKRGMLSNISHAQRTATEIAASQEEYALTAKDFQRMWEKAIADAGAVCKALFSLYGWEDISDISVSVDWGNGILHDEQTQWEQYLQMVDAGILKPEIALGWRFGMPAETPEQRQAIRSRFLPEA